MFKPISLYIGLRYTRARRSNHFISFIALVSMIGLTLGVAVLITVLSVMNGFDRELKTRVLGMIPQATVSSTQILTNWPELVKKLNNISMSWVQHHLPNYKACSPHKDKWRGLWCQGSSQSMKRKFQSSKTTWWQAVSMP